MRNIWVKVCMKLVRRAVLGQVISGFFESEIFGKLFKMFERSPSNTFVYSLACYKHPEAFTALSLSSLDKVQFHFLPAVDSSVWCPDSLTLSVLGNVFAGFTILRGKE